MRETWMLLEYADRGNLDRALVQGKFMLPNGCLDLVRPPALPHAFFGKWATMWGPPGLHLTTRQRCLRVVNKLPSPRSACNKLIRMHRPALMVSTFAGSICGALRGIPASVVHCMCRTLCHGASWTLQRAWITCTPWACCTVSGLCASLIPNLCKT